MLEEFLREIFTVLVDGFPQEIAMTQTVTHWSLYNPVYCCLQLVMFPSHFLVVSSSISPRDHISQEVFFVVVVCFFQVRQKDSTRCVCGKLGCGRPGARDRHAISYSPVGTWGALGVRQHPLHHHYLSW